MKKTSLLKALALASLPISSTAFGDTPAPISGSVSSFNLALTISTTVDGTVAKGADGTIVKEGGKTIPDSDNTWSTTVGTGAKKTVTTTTENVTKILASKYTTKEFLTDLVKIGVLEGSTATPVAAAAAIKGWSVVKVQATLTAEAPGGLDIGPVKFYLVKKDAAAIELRGIVALDLASRADAVNLKIVSKAVGTEEPVVTSVTTYAGAIKQAGSLKLNLSNGESNQGTFTLGGVYTGTQKLGATKTKTQVILAGAGKITSLAGFKSDAEVVEGSAAFGAGVADANVVTTFGANVTVEDEDVVTELPTGEE